MVSDYVELVFDLTSFFERISILLFEKILIVKIFKVDYQKVFSLLDSQGK